MATSPSDVDITIPPFVIAIDDREKSGHALLFPDGVRTKVVHLPFGDYSIVGFENRVAIERKSIKDLVQTIWGRTQLANGEYQKNSERFSYELRRMRDKGARRFVAIEGTEEYLSRYFKERERVAERFGKRQKATFAATIGFMYKLSVRYGISFIHFQDASDAAAHVYAYLHHAWRFFTGQSSDPMGTYKPPHADNPPNTTEKNEG